MTSPVKYEGRLEQVAIHDYQYYKLRLIYLHRCRVVEIPDKELTILDLGQAH